MNLDNQMQKYITLIGTCHFDPNGFEKLMKAFQSINPDLIFVELPINTKSREFTENDFSDIMIKMIHEIPQYEHFIYYLIPKIKNMIGYEYRAIKEYSSCSNKPIINIDVNPEYPINQNSDMNGDLGESPPDTINNNEIKKLYCKAFCALIKVFIPHEDFTDQNISEKYANFILQKLVQFTQNSYPITLYQDRDQFMAENIIKHSHGKSCVFVGGIFHIKNMEHIFKNLGYDCHMIDLITPE